MHISVHIVHICMFMRICNKNLRRNPMSSDNFIQRNILIYNYGYYLYLHKKR